MNPLQIAKTWQSNGFLDTLPICVEYTLDDGTKYPAIIQLKPKKGILGNLEQLATPNISPKRREKTLENLFEIVASIQIYLKQTQINKTNK